ncbi:hypothetical protein POTOM_059401 [Populus tomentosa]|uniref:Uncharacterized protein n=1 Tax=Populus tomentosa TaxID=118781 RepID=A0A8X8C226_POPTO|nr:hypothetical protein POTOM_059401 [Populus tomentosa]
MELMESQRNTRNQQRNSGADEDRHGQKEESVAASLQLVVPLGSQSSQLQQQHGSTSTTTTSQGPFMGSISSQIAPASKSAPLSFHGGLAFYDANDASEARRAMASNPHMLGFHHQLYPQNLVSDDNYMRKTFREDLFKETTQQQSTETIEASNSAKSRTGVQDQETAGSIRPATNILPTPMWAVAPAATTNGGNTFWMLPVGGGATPAAAVTEPQMWTFPTAGAAGGVTSMQRVNFGGSGRVSNPVQLGSMIVQQQVGANQQLGLGLSESNMGMIFGGVNAYSSSRVGLGMDLEQNNQEKQPQGSDSGDENPNDSQ